MFFLNTTGFPHKQGGRFLKQLFTGAAAVMLSLSLAARPVTVLAESDYKPLYFESGLEDYYGEMESNKKQPVQTNKIPSWPKGPAVTAAGAVVMDADSGTVLYAKNPDMRLYPASITKVMTALLAYENLQMSDTVTFSENAVFGIEPGSSNIGLDVGESITVDQALYGLMIASANEVAIALGERISGSEEEFVKLMNRRARELGCTNTNFVTTNGLHDKNHYSTAPDMALIAKEAFKYPKLIEYMSQLNYHFEASANQPDDFWLGNTNDFLNGAIPCEDVIGGKTGYTDQARETLITFAARDDMHLVCTIMRDEPPYQYYDTIDLLNYGFENFKNISVAQKEDRFTLKSVDFLTLGSDLFGNSSPYYSVSENASVTIPKKASFQDLTAEITASFQNSPEAENTQEKTVEAGEASPVKSAEAKTPETSSDASTSSDTSSADGAKAADGADKSEAGGANKTKADGSEEDSTASAASAETPDASGASLAKEDGRSVLGEIHYRFGEYSVGSANVLFTPPVQTADAQSTAKASDEVVPEELHGIRALAFHLVHTGAHGSVYLNILLLVPLVLAITFILCVIFFIRGYFAELKRRRRRRNRRQKRKK